MADQSSGRNNFNAGSDSAKHHTTASEQHARTPKAGPATPTTYRHVNGAVGNGTPPAVDGRSKVRS
jgi:hypothetical protein